LTAASAASVASATSVASSASSASSASAASTADTTPTVDMGSVDFARSVDEAEQVVFFMMSFCVITLHD
jgi:hypothetical protein